VLVLASLSVRASEPVKTEVDGTWEITQFSHKGKDDQETVNEKFIVIREKGTQTVTKQGKPWNKFQYALNSNATSKEITWRDAKDAKVVFLGIYEIKGDTMKVAIFADDAKKTTERPKDFFKPTADKIIATLQRVKER
jgi:uncharacterized protein (TIGR03067 family)